MGKDNRSEWISWVGKFVLYYSLLIALQAWLINLFLNVSTRHLLEFVSLLIAPSLVSGPLIYKSRRNIYKVNSWLFIVAVEFHFVFFTLVIVYAGFLLAYVPQSSFLAIFVCLVSGSLITGATLFRRIKSFNERGNEAALSVMR